MPEYTQESLDFLGPEWATLWSSATPDDIRDVAGIGLQLMAILANPHVIRLLSKSSFYRYRTGILFGVTWSTQDELTYWASRSDGELVNLENAWARDRLEHFHDYQHDNIYIAEGQYIAGCIREICFSVAYFLNQLILESEEEREREVCRFLRFI